MATARLRASGLPVPQQLVAADDVKKGKPDPEPYLRGAEKIGFRASECLVIEDAVTGIRSARAAGAKIIGLVGTFDSGKLAEADALIQSLAQISVEVKSDGLLVRVP